jgi:hypothetical protein
LGKEKMSWRKKELNRMGNSLSWLPKEEAAAVYARASASTSETRHGLNEEAWPIRERWDVEKISEEEAVAKLSEHIRSEEFFVVFGREDVCRIARAVFISHWRDMFCPARDDVVLIPESDEWCVFYCHEDEFEAGLKKQPNQPPEPTVMSVTPRADARVAPATTVAHL